MKRTNNTAKKVVTDAQRELTERALKDSPKPKLRDFAKKVEKDLQHAERLIIIGLITDNEFCKSFADTDLRLYESPTAKRMAAWVQEYYKEYQEAPGQAIQGIYYQKLKEGLDKDTAEDIEDILDGLDEEYREKPLPTRYLKNIATEHFNNRRAEEQINYAKNLDDTNDKLEVLGVESVSDSNSLVVESVYDDDEPLPSPLISPWLREGETVMLYAPPETGKTWLSILICRLLDNENYTEPECEVGEWQVKEPAKSMFVVGERGGKVKHRFGKFDWLGRPIKTFDTSILDRAKQPDDFTLSKRKYQKQLIQELKKNPDIKLVVFDNLGTLFDMENENDNSEWNTKVKPLFRDLEAVGVAHILVHHSGKEQAKGLRGASAMLGTADVVLRLEKIDEGEEETKMRIMIEKQNDGKKFAPFGLRFYKVNDKETRFELMEGGSLVSKVEFKKREILKGLHEGSTQKSIAEQIGISPQNLTSHIKTMRKKGLLTDDNEITDYGHQILEEDIGEE